MRYEKLLKNIGQSIRTTRKQKKMMQCELAELSGVNQNYISEIENGKRNLTLQKLNDLADALGVEISELLR